MYRAVLFDAYVLRPGLSRPAVVSSIQTVYSATNLSLKYLRVFTTTRLLIIALSKLLCITINNEITSCHILSLR